jgi:hypothetical protein
MARIRSIHPDACDSEKLCLLSDAAERTYWRLLTQADDEGRGKDGAVLLASKLYAADPSKTPDLVDIALDELADAGFLIRYEVDGKRYFQIHDFRDWQNPRHPTPSKLPAPPEPTTDGDPKVTGGDRRNPTANGSAPPEERANPPHGVEGRGEGVGEGGGEPAPRAATAHDLLRPGASPSLLSELDDTIETLLFAYDADMVEAAVQQLLDQRLRFPFPSKVRAAIEQLLPTVEVVKPSPYDATQAAGMARIAENQLRQNGEVCEECSGSAMVIGDDDLAGPCPSCRPDDARLEAALRGVA